MVTDAMIGHFRLVEYQHTKKETWKIIKFHTPIHPIHPSLPYTHPSHIHIPPIYTPHPSHTHHKVRYSLITRSHKVVSMVTTLVCICTSWQLYAPPLPNQPHHDHSQSNMRCQGQLSSHQYSQQMMSPLCCLLVQLVIKLNNQLLIISVITFVSRNTHTRVQTIHRGGGEGGGWGEGWVIFRRPFICVVVAMVTFWYLLCQP